MLAKVIVTHSVKTIVEAWDNANIDARQAVSRVLEVFHHPFYLNPNSAIQNEMGGFMKTWIDKMPGDERSYILNALTKVSQRSFHR
jgi:hypothetical protein